MRFFNKYNLAELRDKRLSGMCQYISAKGVISVASIFGTPCPCLTTLISHKYSPKHTKWDLSLHWFLVDKMSHMVGSYPPKMEIQSYTTPAEDAPSGMMARGSYTVQSLFTDDDKHEHLKWEWSFEIKKDWKD